MQRDKVDKDKIMHARLRGFGKIGAGLMLSASLLALGAPARAAESSDAASPESASGDSEGQIVVRGLHDDMESLAATKSPLPIAETPQSISVVTADDIARLGLANLNQSLRYVAGVTPETRGASAEVYDQFKLRGFDAPVYLDGLKQFASASGYASPQVDMSRLDSIEVVKGPASALYGQSSPGGLVAMTSKLPLDEAFYGAASATYGSYNLYRVDADVGGKLSDAVSVRLYGSANGADTQQYYGSRARQTLSGAVTFKIDPATTLTVLGAWSHDPKNGNYSGAPGYGTLFDNPNGKIDTRYADGEPSNYFRRNQEAGTYILTHDFGANWHFRASGRYQHVDTDLGAIYETGVPADAAMAQFARASYATHETLDNWTFDHQLSGTFTTGPVRHALLVGVDYQTAHSFEAAAFGTAQPINAYDPVYGTQQAPTSPYTVPGYTPGAYADVTTYNIRQHQTGIYAQDTMSWGGLRLMLSGRHDWASTRSGTDSQTDRKFTGRAGLLYKTSFGLAPYVSYATSFEPQSARLATGGLARPSLGKQVEIGAKFQPNGSAILVTAAWFHIEQTGVVTTNPVTFLSSQSGKYRSEGFEIEARAPLPYGFALRAAYSHQRVRDVADDDARYVGGGLIGAGDGNLAVNLDWTARSGPLKGLNLGAGLRHIDGVYGGVFDQTLTGNAYRQYYTPSYTLVDAMAHYDLANLDPRLQGLNLALNVTNLFNKKYLTSCYLYPAYSAWCWYGQRRTIQGTISFRW
jgi:iron complex outermembrane receptor protein